MNYKFKNAKDYLKFLSSLREGEIGIQSSIYFDDKNKKVIKVFSLNNSIFNCRKKEAKLKELMKLRKRLPTAALPEEIIECEGKCVGYVMPIISNCTSLGEFKFSARKHKSNLLETLKIACELARFIDKLHSEGIVFGDLHPNQFMTKNGKIYVCDTDSWGFENKGLYYEADRAGRPEYVDPKIRDFSKEGVAIKGYTQEADYFSLAVVIFEMLVGYNPYDGIYSLAKDFDRPLRALNGLSILGNHGIKGLDSFKMQHVAWMSEELQNDFLRIFEKGERFNILPSVEKQAQDIKKCAKNHFYNSARYSRCPLCEVKSDSNALKSFREAPINAISYAKNGVFAKKKIRKILNFSTILDYDQNAIHLKDDGTLESTSVTPSTEKVCFSNSGLVVKFNRMTTIKQLLYTLLGRMKSAYGVCSLWEKIKKCFDSKNPAYQLEIVNNKGEILYSTIILKVTSQVQMAGDHLFYVKNRNKLVDVCMSKATCSEKTIDTIKGPFIYAMNEMGEYCICRIDRAGQLAIKANGNQRQLGNEIPISVKFDPISKTWCVVTKNKSNYNTYVVPKNNLVQKQFESFYYGGLSIRNSIFYNSMLIIPSDKRIVFLKSGEKLANSRVIEMNFGVINPNSMLSISYNPKNGGTYLYVQNVDQIYKFRLKLS